MEQVVQSIQDSLRASQSVSTPFDSIWTRGDVPTVAPSGLEQIMLSNDKIFVVLAVVLLIWIGLIFFVYRTDRRLSQVERSLEDRIYESDDEI
ncbi:MAG: hypothetical protein BMS9Abin05_1360 [Rhodothermia bacterium]|nr:MAG: hypothetical protein BMS9Abin05_1360 [Rhodothermia bacterium]